MSRPGLNFVAACWLLVLLLGLASCSGMARKVEPLDVSLADLSLLDVGLVEQRFGVALRVRNPNGFDVPVEGMRYTLEVNEQPFAQGVASGRSHIPKYGEAVIQTEVTSNLNRLLPHLQALQQERRLHYRLQGEADLGGWRGLQPFSLDGEIALPDFVQ